MILLHGFNKNDRATPDNEKELARKRMKTCRQALDRLLDPSNKCDKHNDSIAIKTKSMEDIITR